VCPDGLYTGDEGVSIYGDYENIPDIANVEW
jgi:hypothetical protein